MTDPLAPAEMTYTAKIAQNAEIALKSGSSWVVAVFGVLGGIYASLSPAQQAQLVEQFPFLTGWTPIITLVVAFLIAKLKPSDVVSSSTQALIEEVARLRLNVFLRARGSTELPDPVPAPLPAPAAPVVVPVVMPVLTPTPATSEPAAALAPAPVSAPSTAPGAPPPPPPVPADLIPAAAEVREPAEPVTRVDVKLPLRPILAEAPELPIDPRLLMSLIQQYMRQTKP